MSQRIEMSSSGTDADNLDYYQPSHPQHPTTTTSTAITTTTTTNHPTLQQPPPYPNQLNTCYVLDSIPNGAFLDVSGIVGLGGMPSNLVFTQNTLDPRTRRPITPSLQTNLPHIQHVDRFQTLQSSTSPISNPTRSPSQPSSTLPTVILKQSPGNIDLPPPATSPTHSSSASPPKIKDSPSSPSNQPIQPSHSPTTHRNGRQRRASAPEPPNQQLRRSSRLLKIKSKSLNQLSTVKNSNKPSVPKVVRKNKQPPPPPRQNSKNSKVVADTKTSAPPNKQTGTNNLGRKRKRVPSTTTTQQPKPKVAKVRARQLVTTSSSATGALSASSSETNLRVNPSIVERVRRRLSKLRSRPMIPTNLASISIDLPLPPSAQSTRKIKPKAKKLLQLHSSSNSHCSSNDVLPSTLESTATSTRSSRRIKSKGALRS